MSGGYKELQEVTRVIVGYKVLRGIRRGYNG